MANIIGLNKPGKRTGVMNEPKAYLCSRDGHGMPGARDPFDEYTEEGRKRHEAAFGKSREWYEQRDVGNAICTIHTCEYLSPRKASGCVMYNNVFKCSIASAVMCSPAAFGKAVFGSIDEQ